MLYVVGFKWIKNCAEYIGIYFWKFGVGLWRDLGWVGV
jgi:hypothetical protein